MLTSGFATVAFILLFDPKGIVPMKAKLMNFLRDEEGLTTVEYAVAGALITVAVVAAFTALGGSVAGTISIIDAVLPG